jgi:hypothetical protein
VCKEERVGSWSWKKLAWSGGVGFVVGLVLKGGYSPR